jgi:VanZ family protein
MYKDCRTVTNRAAIFLPPQFSSFSNILPIFEAVLNYSIFSSIMLKRIIRYTWPPAVVAAIIFYLCCLIPVNDIPDMEFRFFIPTDKIVHFLMFFGLAGVASINYIHYKKEHIIILKLIVFAILIPVIYGGLIEIMQAEYFTERTGDWFDFLADALGVIASLPVSLWFRRFMLDRQLREEI